jgi:hypothetical protein
MAAEYACEISIQSDEKSDCASVQQSLCGIALNFPDEWIERFNVCCLCREWFNWLYKNNFKEYMYD